VLIVDKLTKSYPGKTAVSAISFEVKKGEIMGFLGPNGAGKTTTLRMITGFLLPTSGQIRVDGLDHQADAAEVKRRIGYLPEGVPMYAEMRVREYLRYRAGIKGIDGSESVKAIDFALERASVQEAKDRIIGQLSKGFRQRVGLADALLSDPPLLILDEPTSGLDPNQVRYFRELIRSFRGEKTVLLSTHVLSEVEASCEKVVVIHDGKIVGGGDPETLRADLLGGKAFRVVATRSEEKDIKAMILALDGVSTVDELPESTSDVVALRVMTGATSRPLGGHDGDIEGEPLGLREPASVSLGDRIFRTVADAGLTLRELKEEQTSLESVFAELTVGDAQQQGGGAELDAVASSDEPPPEDDAGAESEGDASEDETADDETADDAAGVES